MNPDWQLILTTLLRSYAYKTLAREVLSSPGTLNHYANGGRKGPRMAYETGARLIALYDHVTARDSAEIISADYAEWAGDRAAHMMRRSRGKVAARMTERACAQSC